MKKNKALSGVVELVRYGMQTLGVGSDEMFHLLETSKDYTQEDDYPRWLAARIIALCEANGMAYAQLLTKKFNIIEEMRQLVGDKETILSSHGKSIISELLGDEKNIIDYNLQAFASSENPDLWADSSIDIDSENSEFYLRSSDVFKHILDGQKSGVLLTFLGSGASEKTRLNADRKSSGLSLPINTGEDILARLISLAQAFPTLNLRVVTLSSPEYYSQCGEVFREYSQYWGISEASLVKRSRLYEDSFDGGDVLLVVWDTKTAYTGIRVDGKLYSYSLELQVPVLASQQSSTASSLARLGYARDAYGFLEVASKAEYLHTSQVLNITKENLWSVITTYGVSEAYRNTWQNKGIPELENGLKGYDVLAANCLPIFLFASPLLLDGPLSEIDSTIVTKLLQVADERMWVEAKLFKDFCLEFTAYFGKDLDSNFNRLREQYFTQDIFKEYESKLEKLKALVLSESHCFLNYF